MRYRVVLLDPESEQYASASAKFVPAGGGSPHTVWSWHCAMSPRRTAGDRRVAVSLQTGAAREE